MLIPPQAALVLATALVAARPVPIPPQGGREVVTLGPGQWRRHEIALEAGQFLQGTLHQRGVDVKLRLVAPDGSAIEDDVDSSEGPTGMEPVSMLARVAGVHAIEVWAPYDVPEPGAYEIETAAPRLPTPRDRQRLEAERLMAAGGRVMPGRSTSAAYRRVGLSQETAALAIERYGAAIPLWAALGEPCWQAEAEQCLGITETWDGYEGRFAASEEHLHQALDHWQECGDAHKFAETVLFTGRLFVATSRYREAAEAYEFGADLPDLHPVLRAQFMVQLAKTYGLLGDTERAVRHGEAILPYLRDQQFVQGTAVVLTYLANAYYRRGELQRASEQAGEALALRRQVNPEWRTMQGEGLMESLLTLADIYDALGEPEIALGYLEEGMETWGAKNPLLLMNALTRTAAILRRNGEPERALPFLQRAVDLSRQPSDRSEIDVRLERARVLMDARDLPGARTAVDSALALSERTGDRFAAAEACEMSGRLHLRAGDRAAAGAALSEGLALRRFIGDRVGEAATLHVQAQLALASADPDGARVLLEKARAIVASQRGLIATPQLRATWAATTRRIDEDYVDVLMALHVVHPEAGFDGQALEASDSSQARSLLDVLTEPAGPPDAPASAPAAHERSVRGRLTTTLDRQVRARASRQPQPELDALADEVRQLSVEHQQAQAALRAADPRYAVLTRQEPLRLVDLQRQLLDADTTLIEFFLGDERGHAWVVGSDRLRSYELPARARIEAAVEAARRALSVPPADAAAAGAPRALRALADLVLPPDRGWLRGRRMVVVADGALHYVPFAALPDATGQPLVTRFEIANVPSASVAAHMRRALAERVPAPRAIAVVADPVYDGSDPRLSGSAPGGVANARLTRATRDFRFENGRLPRLPFTRREALAITALAPATSTAALDFRANLDTALAPELASYRYVHFAAHGLLNDVRPELSGVVLSLVDQKGQPRSGLLTAPDVSSLRLGAELVVLSSCRSAEGREVRGEGLVGLTRAFMYAGAPRVVASLWPVDDVASSELMTRMYRGMLGPGRVSPTAALRAAQLEILRHRKWRAPYYWAGFQLQGEWR